VTLIHLWYKTSVFFPAVPAKRAGADIEGVGRMAESRKARLETWKEVASYFGKDQRTVKRWEFDRGLPIHRLPGAGRSRIYADVQELEAWLKGVAGSDETFLEIDPDAPGDASDAERASSSATAHTLSPTRRHGSSRAAGILGLVGVMLVAALATGWMSRAGWTPPASTLVRRSPSLAAQRQYLAGMDDWTRRTPESLNRAVAEFNAAIRQDPDYAEAYVGLANCYNLMREYTLMPANQAYPLARAAAEHALKIDSRLAAAHSALAFVDFYWGWDADAARREYETAIALEPGSDLNHHWFATFLSSQGDFPRALQEIDRAAALNPGSLAIRADRAFILFMSGRRAEAWPLLERLAQADPTFLSPHNYIAGFALLEGRDQDYLRETEIAARLTGDRQRLALADSARRGYAKGGRRGLLLGLLEAQKAQFRIGVVAAYEVAETCAMLGDADQAYAYLRMSLDRHETNAIGLRSDPTFTALRATPRFRAMMAEVRPGSAAS
jgi:Tfp pilus assembly protein PilF